ncbi:MAG: hypothetical protein EAZ95_13460 [Bacteroidetes bacterium]|nr:MAG: hypothetical protein EAZ95_13460 [Bacteroidota bacterium]
MFVYLLQIKITYTNLANAEIKINLPTKIPQGNIWYLYQYAKTFYEQICNTNIPIYAPTVGELFFQIMRKIGVFFRL